MADNKNKGNVYYLLSVLLNCMCFVAESCKFLIASCLHLKLCDNISRTCGLRDE